ncbi:hypothetical protein GLOIN_2v1475822 [Rhizophagus irregularis DAOM 181602=DAOM 197198]|uniref:Uncharacterized protein n=1 Tax=Rhizophagus irregularis (strain DAOM 181602 / DAOM 197198 / MUCL 43194) TaxID=747089 RepID=A0A2P4QBF5_RHIID|nr:hypothetical protein GLOIN_2v1475822 [Rhizophagus irregularis DAOM 181602=DAOM 197198]POG74971.1 hypothetical protein GLOIN_2v1475822 [Rhizophagus irregularis DAOM 181602=DAOM 197198]|eukprot:XP_025181837.1 hypothetical protein GLOIN_2v1475822 [Rhizophagus irregularis DAOM 181602=DAOM 197198]
MDPLNDTTRYLITLQPSQPSLITHHVTHNQENQSPFNSVAINNQSPIQSTSTFINFNTPKSTNRWTTSETQMLIEEDKIESTGGEAIQNDWEFFKDTDSFLRKDLSIVAPITSDSIYGIKRKEQENAEEQVKENDSRQQKKACSKKKKQI